MIYNSTKNYKLYKNASYRNLGAPVPDLHFKFIEKYGFNDKSFKIRDLPISREFPDEFNNICRGITKENEAQMCSASEYLNFMQLYLEGLEIRSISDDEPQDVIDVWQTLKKIFKIEYVEFLISNSIVSNIYLNLCVRMPGVFDDKVFVEIKNTSKESFLKTGESYPKVSFFIRSENDSSLILTHEQFSLLRLIDKDNISGYCVVSEINQKLKELDL